MRPAIIFSLLALGFGILFPSLGQATNIAPVYGVATANSTYPGYGPELTIDGNWGSQWASQGHATPDAPLWLQVDLQNTYEIGQIVLVSANDYNRGMTNVYNLYNSTNETDWTLIGSGTLIDGVDYVHTYNLSSTNQDMRYAKYEVVGGSHWALLFEMEIYPVGSPVPLPGSLMLLGSGLLGGAFWRARRKFMG